MTLADEHADGVPSTAAVGGHPIHPMLIPFPIAFLPAALVTDIVHRQTGAEFWAVASFWLVLAGLVTGVLAAVFGVVDFMTIRRARSRLAGWVHALGNVLALGLAVANLVLRWGPGSFLRWDQVPVTVPEWGLALSAATAVVLVVTGWAGGELSYRHKVGVVGPRHTTGFAGR